MKLRIPEKANKSELWVAIVGMISPLLAQKLGWPEELLEELLYVVGGIATAYIASRGYAKPREAQAEAQALEAKAKEAVAASLGKPEPSPAS